MKNRSFIDKICDFAVDHRRLVFVLVAVLLVFCVISSGWVKINGELTDYLAPTTDTRKGLDLMDNEFTT